jgi:bidirectional [NiFe] hydrogenase diaphorase subunit
MQPYSTHPAVPSSDPRWQIVDSTMRRHGRHQSALIETLHTVQREFGYLDGAALRYVAMSLRLPLSNVYGVATFYHLFRLTPLGEHTCVVCTGTACHVHGSQLLLTAAQDAAEQQAGETSNDGKLSLLTERCLGVCGLAPVVDFGDEVSGKASAETVSRQIRAWQNRRPR